MFGRVQEPLQHIFETSLLDFLVEAFELALRSVALLFLLILLVLWATLTHIHLFGPLLTLPVHAAVLFLFVLVHIKVLELPSFLGLVLVFTLQALDLSLKTLSLLQNALIKLVHLELCRVDFISVG